MKLLILRLSSIGDIVLTSPVLRCLKEQVAGAEVHFATKEAFADLVRYDPHLDRVHELGSDLGDLIKRLKAERFDRVIDLHKNLRTARIKRALRVPSSSFHKLNASKWLLVNLKVDKMPRRHIVDRYMDTVAHLGVRNDGLGLSLTVPPDREVPIGSLPTSHQCGFVALAIGGAHATKRAPLHKLVDLARRIEGPLVLIGGPEDRPIGAAIGHAIGGRVFDTTGMYDLLGSASLIARAKAVVTHDSGAMHMACAFQRPVLSMWGNTVPAFGMGPYQPRSPSNCHVFEVDGLNCRPCSKIGFEQCPNGHFRCMELQDVERIADVIGTISDRTAL
ncbi:MAG: glycosyltransferase family 9 protein [Flavobacteriales bacterium]|nr:glycosyltransferase family 9 protein [Flavobacteriales bacterium]MCB0794045.1 glycosyltransferase family 9 protein [Flavobacteriales bacterium]